MGSTHILSSLRTPSSQRTSSSLKPQPSFKALFRQSQTSDLRASRARLWLLFLVACLTLPALAAEEHLPTPYSAEELREVWREGFELDSKVWTPKEETLARTRVEAWSESEVTTSEQTISASGEPQSEKRSGTTTWEALRDHARFDAARAHRERQQRDTALGSLEGWLYTVNPSNNTVLELFFADGMPGPPVTFKQSIDGAPVFKMEQIRRSE